MNAVNERCQLCYGENGEHQEGCAMDDLLPIPESWRKEFKDTENEEDEEGEALT